MALASLVAGCAHHSTQKTPEPQATTASYPYTKPLTSLGAKYGALPTAVQNTVRAQAGVEELADVLKESTADRVYYKILFKQTRNFPPLYVAADGSVLNPDLTVAVPAPQEGSALASAPPTKVQMQDLPTDVSKTIKERASNVEPASITKEIWGNHVVYVVSFKEQIPKLYIMGEDGATLTEATK